MISPFILWTGKKFITRWQLVDGTTVLADFKTNKRLLFATKAAASAAWKSYEQAKRRAGLDTTPPAS